MKLSIIIPTRNRAEILRKCLSCIQDILTEAVCEVVIVNNNSNDETENVIKAAPFPITSVFEARTAFTRARNAGAQAAKGEFLMYIDDDTFLKPGALRAAVRFLDENPDCGVVAGRITPSIEGHPAKWALECQAHFNGWSVFNELYYPWLGSMPRTVDSACGPLMVIRRSCYDETGGFPPDTIGVESDVNTKSFRKLYVGPGDYGLCLNIQRLGYRIMYVPDVSCEHYVPPIRHTIAFWRSRMLGEGHHIAVTAREFYLKKKQELGRLREEYFVKFLKAERRLKKYVESQESNQIFGMSQHELDYLLAMGFLEMDAILNQHPSLSKLLWTIAKEGINDNEFSEVLTQIPDDLVEMLRPDRYYAEAPLTSQALSVGFLESKAFRTVKISYLALAWFWAKKSIRRIFSELKQKFRVLKFRRK